MTPARLTPSLPATALAGRDFHPQDIAGFAQRTDNVKMIPLPLTSDSVDGMIKMDHYGYIRTAYRIYKKSVEQICRETGHSRETVRKPNRNISTCPFAIHTPSGTIAR